SVSGETIGPRPQKKRDASKRPANRSDRGDIRVFEYQETESGCLSLSMKALKFAELRQKGARQYLSFGLQCVPNYARMATLRNSPKPSRVASGPASFLSKIDREAWLRFFLALAGLSLAFAAAVFSSAASETGNLLATAVFSSLALFLAGLVG